MPATKRLSAWVEPDVGEAFRTLAEAQGLSESKLLVGLVEAYLARAKGVPARQPVDVVDTLSERVTIRLRPGDALGVAERAAHRRQKPATYLSALVRAHLIEDPVVPDAELAELERALEAVSLVGRSLQGIARRDGREALQGVRLAQTLAATREAVEDVRQQLKAYIRIASTSWEAPYE